MFGALVYACLPAHVKGGENGEETPGGGGGGDQRSIHTEQQVRG